MKRCLPFLAAGFLVASPAQPHEDGEWIAVPPQSLLVEAGSPLDFSGLLDSGRPGDRGPVVPRGDRLVFAGDGSPVRFNCAMLHASFFQVPEFPTHDEADQLAAQMRLHGYSLVRQQAIDFRLTRHARFDLDIDAEQLDRFYYLLAALKRNRVSWMLDIVSGPGKGVRGEGWQRASPDDLRVRMHFDPAARELWLKLVDQVFAQVNPYTGLSTLADPALAFVVGANENSMAFSSTADALFPTGFDAYFDRWVRERYPSRTALAKALPDLSPAELSGEAGIALPSGWRATGPRMALLLRYVSALEVETDRWMSARLAERGFHGPNLGYQDWNAASNNLTRASLPIVDVHAYGGELTSFEPGAVFNLPSATSHSGLGRWTLNAGLRWLDRPLVATEYDTPFPGPYRYESGILFPALAAFQGYDLICRTTMSALDPAIPPPDAGYRPLRGYAGGMDPNVRAQETLATMLFFRGDVAPATRTVAVPFGDEEFDRPGSSVLRGVGPVSLLARFGLVLREQAGALPSDVLLAETRQNPVTIPERAADKLMDVVGGDTSQRTEKLIAALRANGTLGADNLTSASGDVLQSQTGQIILDRKLSRILVKTPRTEAVSTIGPEEGIGLDALEIVKTDSGALVGVTALDGLPIRDSRKLLLIMTGDVRNTGMRLDGVGDSRRFVSWGKLPMLMRRVRADVSLNHRTARTGRLSILSLRGAALAEYRVSAAGDGRFHFRLDTAAAGAPTTFFLLEPDY